MKPNQQRSGTIRCQRCLKFGHYTYECQNEVAYRYRPSRTVMYKQKIKMTLNKDKGPLTIIRNPDKQRRYQDRPSSSDEDQNNQESTINKKYLEKPAEDVKFEEKEKPIEKVMSHQMEKQKQNEIQRQKQREKQIVMNTKKIEQVQDSESSSSSSQISSSNSQSSNSSSSDQSFDSKSDSKPQKKRNV